MTENWVPVAGWEGWLEVSTLARVRTLQREAPSAREHQIKQLRPAKVLSPWLNHSGYLTVSTLRDGKRTKQFVHSLVAKAFVPGWFDGATVDHRDGNKTNNLPENLEWVTRQENSRRQNADGRGVGRGEKHPSAKLADAEIPKLFQMRSDGLSLNKIGRHFGVSDSLVHKITTGLRRRT